MKKDSKSTLKIMQIVFMFVLAIIGGTILQATNVKEDMTQVANSSVNEEIEVARTYDRNNSMTTTSRFKLERTQENIEENKNENQEEVQVEEPLEVEITEYKSIDEITISRDMDLTENCGVSRDDFIELMTNLRVDRSGFFEENAGLIYDLCQEYELNEIFFCGLIAGESGWNIAGAHRSTHNYISMMSGGKLIYYSSDEEGLEAAAKLLHNKYLTEGGAYYRGKTLSSVQKIFCPNSSTWVGLIYGCMSQIVK